MQRSALITGGAGFIGSHLADRLLERGYRVRALDSLSRQVHDDASRPGYLDRDVELVVGDVRDPAMVRGALEGVDVVFHLAAAVGVGQSMYQVTEYVGVNNLGTAVLMEALLELPVERLVVASSMSVYGEGLYRDHLGALFDDIERSRDQLERGQWEPRGPQGQPLLPVPTPETKRPSLASVYALTKLDQERMSLILGQAYRIPTVALRLFNVYGPRQSLSNPYTGVLAIFASRYLNDRRPLIFEDGEQRRDFVHVADVARACCLALETEAAAGEVLNIGSGTARTVRDVAEQMGRVMGKTHLEPDVIGEYRAGDIRHCTADVSRAAAVLGYCPAIDFATGLSELAEWLEPRLAHDRVDEMRRQLTERGLSR
jgi:dTDP-L-rhamnose 4-epimerase